MPGRAIRAEDTEWFTAVAQVYGHIDEPRKKNGGDASGAGARVTPASIRRRCAAAGDPLRPWW